ncbi:hypothetical protein C0993_009512, partial [Termitomyces sp. T159_Od127]
MSERSRREKTKQDKLTEYKRAREGGKRTFKEEDVELYDEVTEEQYRSIVRGRLQQDDFVVDDGVAGYTDNGMDDWTGGRDEYDSEEGAPKKIKSKKAKTDAQRSRPRQREPSTVAPSISAYRPKVSEAEEDEFMSSLLGGMDSATTSASAIASKFSRKRKQSPVPDSSTPFRHELRSKSPFEDASSDGYLDDGVLGPQSDDYYMSPKKKFRTTNGETTPTIERLASLEVASDTLSTKENCTLWENSRIRLQGRVEGDEDGNIHETDIIPSPQDVHADFEMIRKQIGVKSWKGKFVKRKYAFGEKEVPRGESQWLKVVYGFDGPQIPSNACSPNIAQIFGANTSAFELLVLKRKIMGPCWLEIKNPQIDNKGVSWCKLEATVSDPKDINPFLETDPDAPREMPPLTVVSLSVRTIVNHQENKREVVCATARIWHHINIDDATPPEQLPCTVHTFVRPLDRFPPNFETQARANSKGFISPMKNERMLLSSLLMTLHKADPDVIIGHEFLGVSLDVLLHRMRDLKVDHWSRIGRFRRSRWPTIGKQGSNLKFLSGRMLCDLASDGAKMAIASKVQIMPLTRQLTNLAGNSWNKTLNGGRAERNEYILLHEFHRLKYICPDKTWGKRATASLKRELQDDEHEGTKTSGKRDKYKGGLVFEPKRGLWDRFVLVMDFNSLYPSIIQEYNIDFTTVESVDDEENGEEKIPEPPSSDVPQGVLPRLIATLVNRRRQVKSLMKDKTASPAQLLQWDIKQQALKLTANSMYGCLGFEYSRFYARPLAALTTFKGREILTHTRELAESMELDVVYGDTDSVFVNSNVTELSEALRISAEFKKAVNERYKLLEIDLDGVFQRLLLLQKKKYAAIKVEDGSRTSTEVKGLDMKRREYSALSKNVSQYVLNQILSGEATENVVEHIHEYLQTVSGNVREGKIKIDDFIIFKRLGKAPEDYPDAKSQPHVQVALRMKAKGGTSRAGDVIPYVFCLEEGKETAKTGQAERAKHPDEVRRAGSELKIDFEYYLAHQVLPPIERLCEPIEGTDRARLAECL